MATTNTVEKIEIIGSSKGLHELEQDLNRVAHAQDNLAGATKSTETVVERSTRAVAAAAKAHDRVLQSVDAAYKAEQQYAKSVAAVDRAFQMQVISAADHARGLDLLAAKYKKLDAANDNMAGGATHAGSVFDRLRASVGLAGDQAAQAQGKFAKAASVLAQFRGLAAGAAGAVGLGGGLALGSIIATTAEFQKLQGSLQTVTGSAAKAEAAMAFLREFAAKTPFDVQQVTEAFIKLKLLGLDPSAEALTSYGNTASAMGKPLMQFIEAIADATTGEFERLKEFGIKAAKDGEKVALTFQGQTTTIENSAKSIEAYLRNIGDTNFAGGMDRQAAQLGGALSNAQDAVANFQAAIGEGGLASAVADAARETAGFLDANHDLAADLGGLLGDFVRDVGSLVDEVGAGAGHMVTKFQEAGRGIASVVAGIAATGPATVAGFMAAWDNFPDLLRAVGVAAFNTFLHLVQEAINESIDEINRLLSVVNSLGDMIGAAPIELVAPVDFEGFKREMTGGAADVAATITATFEDAKAKNEKAIAGFFSAPAKVGDELTGKYGAVAAAASAAIPAIAATGGASSEAGKQAEKAAAAYGKQAIAIDGTIADLQRQIAALGQSEASTAAAEFKARELAKAWETARAAGRDFIPAETLAAIDAASAKVGALTGQLSALTEANAAVDEFFPFEKANREATRLQGILSDTSLGLSDVQRAAIQMKIDKGFVDAQSTAEGLAGKGTKAAEDIGQAFIQNVGDVFADVFSQATRDGEDFFGSLLKSFAGLGSQLAAAGGKNLLGQLFGIKDPKAASAAGIGGLLTGVGSAVPSPSSFSSAPKTSSAAQAISDKLAEGVTKSVSSNLLSSILGSGKSSSHISGLNTNFANALTNMLEAAPEAVRSAVTINSGFRSVARQAELFDAALKKYGSVSAARKWVAPPGNSKHNVGMAADLGYASGATKDWIHANAGKFGLAFPLGNEDWHIELASARGGNTKAIEKGVSQGVQQGLKATAYDQGGYDAGSPRSPSGGMQQMTGAQRGLGAIGAGLGIFGQGYESGSPLSGGVSGALGGFQAAQALGFAGPVGAVAGAALGILGGILGGRAKRKQEHKDKARAWSDMQPDYLAWQKSIKTTMPTSGLSDYFAEQTANFDKFRETGGAAWKYGKNNSTQDFIAVGTAMYQQFTKIREAFRETVDPMIAALNAGRGMDSPFADARNQLVALGQQLNLFIDDTKESYWNLPDQEAKVAEATEAARQQVIKSFDVAEPLSAIGDEMQRLEGAAVGAKKVLMDLGDSAEDAGAIINEKLAPAIARVGENLTRDLQAQLEDLNGKGYLGDFRSLIDEDAQRRKDISTYGLAVDPALVSEVFQKSAQSLVDGAELTGDAFAELIKAFPALAGVVTEFTEDVVKRTASQLKDLRSSYDDRYFTATNDDTTLAGQLAAADRRIEKERQTEIAAGGEAIGELERALAAERLKIEEQFAEAMKSRLAGYADREFAAGNDNSTEAGALAEFERKAQKDRDAEAAAGGGAMIELEKALAAERLAIANDFAKDVLQRERASARTSLDAASSRLQSLYQGLDAFSDSIRGFLSDMKIGDSSTLSMKDQLAESRKVYEETLAKANSGDADARDKLLGVTQTYLDQAKGYFVSSEAYGKIFNEVQASLKATDVKTASQLDLMRSSATWLEKISANTLTVAEALADYLAAEKTVNGTRAWGVMADQNKAIVRDLSGVGINYTGDFGGGQFLNWAASQLPSQQAIINAIIERNRPVAAMQLGGLVGAYADGGIVGNGIWNRDSVLARYAGGGHIGLAGGEFVMPAPRVTPATMPVLEAMRSGRAPGNDNAGVVQAVDRLSSIMERVVVAVAGTGENTRQEIEGLAGEMRSVGRELKKAGGAPR